METTKLTKDIYYPAVFVKRRKKITVEFPDIPGCTASGGNMGEAIHNAYDALETAVINILRNNQSIPKATDCTVLLKKYRLRLKFNRTVISIPFRVNKLLYFRPIGNFYEMIVSNENHQIPKNILGLTPVRKKTEDGKRELVCSFPAKCMYENKRKLEEYGYVVIVDKE